MNKIIAMSLSLSLVLLNGCTADKKVYDLIAKLEARVAALEKIVLPGKEEAVQKTAYEVPVGDSPVLGSKDAKIHVIVFSNFQCPYCARADKSVRELLNDAELKSSTNIVFKNFPFERFAESRPAAKAALAAGEHGKFWEMAEKLFANQNALNAENYKKFAKEIGLDVAKFEKDLKDNDKKYNDLIEKDIKLGAENAKLEGTPWILVGNDKGAWLVEGDINAANIKKIIKDKNL